MKRTKRRYPKKEAYQEGSQDAEDHDVVRVGHDELKVIHEKKATSQKAAERRDRHEQQLFVHA